ncbi:RagB/SusD family nutrient uptake outer membrane protein [Sphingobacterium chuzhouense]|uniref:RagB/SusD family nutrient uptake outer membrane protein n=1 Tax=Sphingobacterium chuzhouense TaxID=1742264 RepID=A0ABR7XUS7_9SPHI|nr:RagB/SusD family nutrient uptake outer membrane protein [Sphingobacterium chuzhouense]MBD1422810.1 RagB/SusD family nutrient uptake outer membrane protein [Sphingobacterium chuzhouense]
MKKYMYIIMACLLFNTSCNILDLEPETSWTGSNIPTEEGHLNGILYGGYERLRSALSTGFLIYGELRAEAFYNNAFQINIDKAINNTLDYDMSYASWQSFYEVIKQANVVLRYAPELVQTGAITEANADHLMGQAYTLRAFAYFYIIRIWGEAPLIIKPFLSDEDLEDYGRAPLSEMYEQIHQDLTEGASLIPASNTERTILTRAAVHAIEAHVYAWEHNYEQAIISIDKVLANTNYSLASLYNPSWNPGAGDFTAQVQASDYAAIFNGGRHKESIFELAFNLADGDNTRFLTSYFSGTNPIIRVRSEFGDTFDSNDWRGIVSNEWSSTGTYKAIKYIIGFSADVDTRNIVLLRLSDLYLLKAESIMALEDTDDSRNEAMGLVNTIRHRAGGETFEIPASDYLDRNLYSQDDLIDLILEERKFELCYEGYRWFDLVRTGRAIDVLRERRELELDPRALIWPIHIDEIRRGSLIEQNEYYR